MVRSIPTPSIARRGLRSGLLRTTTCLPDSASAPKRKIAPNFVRKSTGAAMDALGDNDGCGYCGRILCVVIRCFPSTFVRCARFRSRVADRGARGSDLDARRALSPRQSSQLLLRCSYSSSCRGDLLPRAPTSVLGHSLGLSPGCDLLVASVRYSPSRRAGQLPI